MMDKQYGLTNQTLELYREMVKCGFNFDTAMQHLKELWEHNKAFYLEENEDK